jgi:hypothetical protein
MSAFLTLDEAKVLLKIAEANTTFDDYIELMLPIIEDDILSYTNNDFLDDDDEVDYPANLKIIAASMIQFHMNSTAGKTSESIGDYSASYGSVYPDSINNKLNCYRKLKWD